MADYVKINWENEVPSSSPAKYEIVDDSLGEIATSASIQLVTAVTAGTPLNATNLNHMDDGIFNAQAAADDAQADATQALADAAAAQIDADAAQVTATSALATAQAAVPKGTVLAAWDLIVGSGSGTVTRLAKGANYTPLSVIDGALSWSTLHNHPTCIIPLTHGGILDSGFVACQFGTAIKEEFGYINYVNDRIEAYPGIYLLTVYANISGATSGTLGVRLSKLSRDIALVNWGAISSNILTLSGLVHLTDAGLNNYISCTLARIGASGVSISNAYLVAVQLARY